MTFMRRPSYLRHRRQGHPHSAALGMLTLAALCLSALPALAQSTTTSGYGAHVAYSKAADSDQGNYLVGGHIELGLAPVLGLVGAVDYRSSERFLRNGTEELKVKSVPITLTARLYLPTKTTLSPFLQAGAGWYRVIYDYSPALEQVLGRGDDSVTTFGWHAGAGAKIHMSDVVSLTGEARYIFVDPQKDLGSDVRREISNLDYDSLYFGAGLSFEF
jgi:opacity protein-like surface antigen